MDEDFTIFATVSLEDRSHTVPSSDIVTSNITQLFAQNFENGIFP